MSAFILLAGSDEKRGQVYPTILEFKNDRALESWLADGGHEALDRWEQTEAACFGGWPTAHILVKGQGEDPLEWAESYADDDGEEA